MATSLSTSTCFFLVVLSFMLLMKPATAFGAGNIASISSLEGHNWRHGDIEDVLKTIAFLHGKKWTSAMVKRVYFGNWLRDYSQAMDVGTLKNMQSDTIRILLWVLSFVTFGYATEEFEVTADRLGVYRPEEHIDNPKGYADDKDARQCDPRLRPPIQQIELDIDNRTGMKNYIANEDIGIATSAGYIKFSLQRSIHFGRLYTNGSGSTGGREEDLCEALRCMGQSLHTLEDFSAHSNYIELALREQGHSSVFPHVGESTEIDLRGRRAYPLVTGTFGMVDFFHSVLGEATDHLSQSEVSEIDALNKSLARAEEGQGSGSRDGGDENSGGNPGANLMGLLSQVPGAGDLGREADDLQQASQHQAYLNRSRVNTAFDAPPGSQGGPPGNMIPGTNIDPQETLRKIYPILQFRDKVVRNISSIVEKIPGLEALMDKITETVTMFVMSLLSPFVRPVIDAVTKQLKAGSGGMVDASGRHQFEPWTDSHCTDPTHSLLSKDHFANILNEVAGQVAAVTLQYVAPRILYAWEHPDIPVDQVLNDVLRTFHHPALRDHNCELHNQMYATVENWARKSSGIDQRLSSDSVRNGRNLNEPVGGGGGHSHGPRPTQQTMQLPGGFQIPGIPNVQQIENTFTASFNQNFGGILNPVKKFSGGFTRDGTDMEGEIQPGAYNDYSQNQSTEREPLGGGRQYGGDEYDAPSSFPSAHEQQFGYGPASGFNENSRGTYGEYSGQEPPAWERQSSYGHQPQQSASNELGHEYRRDGESREGENYYQESSYRERRW